MSSPAVQPILVLLGAEVGGNPLQYMMEKAFAHHDLDWRYLSVEVEPDALADALLGVRAMDFHGGHCAGPHKDHIGPLLDGLSEAARQSGTANLFRREGDRLIGENTEGCGLVEALRRLVDPAGKRVVLLGAGGIGRSTALELAAAGAAQITVFDHSEDDARQLAALLAGRGSVVAAALPWDERIDLPDEMDILIHAAPRTPHEAGAELPIRLDTLRPEVVVADTTTEPPDTWLLAEAKAKQCATLDGLTVFIEQVAVGLRVWTGLEANRDVLREAAEEFLGL